MGWKKENKPPHYLFPIGNEFSKEWEKFSKDAKKESSSLAEHLRKAIRSWNEK